MLKEQNSFCELALEVAKQDLHQTKKILILKEQNSFRATGAANRLSESTVEEDTGILKTQVSLKDFQVI